MLRRIRRILFWVVGVPLGIAIVGGGTFVGYVLYLSWQTPSIDDLKPRPETQNSVVYAATGERLGFIPAATLRQEVPSSSVPAFMKQAIVAVEDRRFYKHKGIDYPGILRAAAKDVTSQAVVQGGSTITMQLVRRLYLTRDRTFKRKIEEATLAREMEKRRSKDWILTSYLNDVSFGTVGGQEAVGVQAAARVFFGKPAKALNLTQSVLLAGLPQEPTLYSPVRHPEAAKARRSQVLRAMVHAGMISQPVADRIDRRGLGLHLSHYYTHRRERHFFDYVERELRGRLGAATVRRGGLRVHTTLDMRLQRVARAAIRHRLDRRGDPAAAIASIDVRNGDIRTLATTTKYQKEQFDYASQARRQPGSTFKPIVLLAAIAGHAADPRKTYYVSKPLNLMTGFGRVKVETYSRTYGGRMNLVKATLASDNSVYQQLDLDVGPDLVADTAANMGIDTPLNGYPAEGLGGLHQGVAPLEMARAYATLANGGNRLDISAIHRVDFIDGRASVRLDDPGTDSLFKDGETYEVTKILQQNMKHGTGQGARMGCPGAGKTGTTDSFKDAWFAGYTPRLSTVVWVGYPDRAVPMTNVHGIKVAGATFPAQLWHDYMSVAKGGFCGKFPKPVDRPKLLPFCGRLSVTKHCEPKSVAVDPTTQAPVVATGGAPQDSSTAPVAVPVPDTAIVGAPPSSTVARQAVFTFKAQTAPSTGFECSVDKGAFSACTSPAEYSGLRPGDHVFTVRALSPKGDADATPATYAWTV
ncbi:MAG: penicillin-binding protein, partial [Thermoleophilaceae bacterium]|nr:penicillin-binding protein [Thermoleophilaceae bacterium]